MDPHCLCGFEWRNIQYLHFIKIYKVVKYLLCQILVISPLRSLLMWCNANCWHKPKGKYVMKCVRSVIQSPAAQKNKTQLLLNDVCMEHLNY